MLSIQSSVGNGGKNLPRDFGAVEAALRKIGIIDVYGPLNGILLGQAISLFQGAVNLPQDCLVKPNGKTLIFLNALLDNTLKLASITADSISKGGYKIIATPVIPDKPFQVLLGLSPYVGDCIDVTGRPKEYLMTPALLTDLLRIIQRKNCWSTSIEVRLYVTCGQVAVSKSLPKKLPCPVQPHNGQLLPLDQANNGPALRYLGDSETGPFYGRFLTEHPLGFFLFDYFTKSAILETDPTKRGFDCVTYCGAALNSSRDHRAEASDLAASLGASTIEFEIQDQAPAGKKTPLKRTITLERADPADIKLYFATDRPGTFLVYSTGHVVIVRNNTVHEFAYSKQGYRETPVLDWLAPYRNMRLTVRSL